MKNLRLIFWQKLYHFRIEFALLALVVLIYGVIFLVLGGIPKINEIVLFNDTDVMYGKIFWGLPKVISLPWAISSLLQIPMIFVIIISISFILRLLTSLEDFKSENGGYLALSILLFYFAMGIGLAMVAGSAIANDLSDLDPTSGLKEFIEVGGGTAVCLSFFGGFYASGGFNSKIASTQIYSYIKIACANAVLSIASITMILLTNVGLTIFFNSIPLALLSVTLIFSLGSIVGIMAGLICKNAWWSFNRLLLNQLNKN